MSARFVNDIELSNHELADIKAVVDSSHAAPWISASVDGLQASQTSKLCGVYENDFLASFAWYMQRNWIINDESYAGLSIGLVTTVPSRRNRGHAKALIKGIEDQARQNKIDFLYLAGIPGFYDRLGFTGFAPKSKLVFSKANLPKTAGKILPFEKEHFTLIPKIYAAYATEFSSCSIRKAREWEDLLGPLSSTFLFNQPKIIFNDNDVPICYFCTTPRDTTTIREFIPLIDSDSVITSLSLIAHSSQFYRQKSIEIFAPANGPVWNVAANSVGADFLCFLRPRASNMIKWISSTKELNNFHCNFLLQGDIL